MESTDRPARRLSGTHVVVMFVALCATVVLAPVSVQAAGLQQVKVVGPVTAVVSGTVKVKGPVTARVPGTVRASVTGTVSARPTPPVGAFHVTTNALVSELSDLIPGATRIALTTVVASRSVASAGTVIINSATGTGCMPPNVYDLNATIPGDDAVSLVFPTPVLVDARCATLVLDASSFVTLVGYRVP